MPVTCVWSTARPASRRRSRGRTRTTRWSGGGSVLARSRGCRRGSSRNCSRCPEWSNFAGFQAVVAWQLSHSARVTMWLASWPVAVVPSWHEEQLPSTLPWSTRVTGFQATVAWQASQAVVALMCRGTDAGRLRAVVAGGAALGDARVVEARRQPGRGRVAGVAGIRRSGCASRRARSRACRRGTRRSCRSPACDRRWSAATSRRRCGTPRRHCSSAGATGPWPSRCRRLWHEAQFPVTAPWSNFDGLQATRAVAGIAVHGRRDVAGRLAGCLRVVVAGRAAAARLLVVEAASPASRPRSCGRRRSCSRAQDVVRRLRRCADARAAANGRRSTRAACPGTRRRRGTTRRPAAGARRSARSRWSRGRTARPAPWANAPWPSSASRHRTASLRELVHAVPPTAAARP